MLLYQEPEFALTLEHYFRERLTQAAARLKPPPNDETLWYTGTVLARFGESQQLFSYDDGHLTIRPLALLYKDAHEAQANWERCLILRQLGDLALFLGALFPERYAKRGIGKDYFVGMGGGAYDYLADNAQHNRDVYSQLSNMFAILLELIGEACSKESQFDAKDILALYQRWQSTQDPKLEAQLRTLGVFVGQSKNLQ